LLISSLLNNIDSNKEASVSKVEKLYLPIIMYHHVKEKGLGKDTITPYEFEKDLKYLSENHYTTITMQDLLNFVNNNTLLPEKPIILTFDDGYLSTYRNVFPLLKKYNMKIVLSIVGKSTDAFSRVKDENIEYSHMSWDNLNEMLKSGLVEVQNHTYNLHSYNSIRVGCNQKNGECFNDYEATLLEDLEMLQTKIKENTGNVPTTLAYPYGAYNDNTIKVMKEVGLEAGLTCRYGVNVVSRDMNLFELRRICRAHGDPVQKLLEKIAKQLNIGT
jgi:peptidoglycan/xylan/chitin deacetylase (PgdA/CDA1 family)